MKFISTTEARKKAKAIQKRAQGIADHAKELRAIETEAKKISQRTAEIENEVLARTMNSAPRNNRSDFTNKEVYLLLLDEMSKKLDKHLDFCDNITSKYIPEFNKQCEALAKVIDDMPSKGFCGKVEKMYQDMYPEGTEEPNIPQKVNLLWNDRRWLKGLLVFITALGLGNLLLLIGGYLMEKL